MRALLLLLLLPASAAAQPIGPDAAARAALAWPSHRDVADHVSTGIVIGALAAPCLAERTWRCLGDEALRVGAVIGLAELVKRTVRRERPDRSDRLSFFSEHTAIACVVARSKTGLVACAATAYLRIAADAHWLTDVMAGAAVGQFVMRVSW